jgi:hypothetical protein
MILLAITIGASGLLAEVVESLWAAIVPQDGEIR